MKYLHFPANIRGRLILGLSFGAVVIFALLTLFLSLFIWNVLQQQIDHHIHIITDQARQIVLTFDGQERDSLLQHLVSSQGMTVVLLSSDGTVLLQTNSPDIATSSQNELEALLTAPTDPNSERYHFTIGAIRFMTVPIMISNVKGVLAVGYSVKIIEDSFRNLLILLMFAMVITLLLILLGIKKIIDKSLLPLEIIAEKARSVSNSRNLEIKFSESNQTEEIHNLSVALNIMTTKLKHIFDTEHELFESAAHTIKTPLAVARSKVETFPKIAQNDKEAVLSSLDKASDTIKDLLLISRMETSQNEYHQIINLSQIIEELVSICETLASEKQITVSTLVEPNIQIYGNAALIKRALANVIQNSVTYTPNMGKITISLVLDRENNQVIIVCADTGIGIKSKEIPHVFDRFYRGSNVPVHNGSGLGLAITKATIEQMNGKISIRSKLRKGTSIKIRFPAYH